MTWATRSSRNSLTAWNSFHQLSTTSARELLRNGRSVLTMLTLFATLIVLCWALELVLNESLSTPAALLQANLGVSLVMGYMAIAFVGTSTVIVGYRQRGTLRLLSATPISRTLFALAQAPIRLGIAALEAGVVFVIVGTVRALDITAVLRLSLTTVLGFGMLVGLALLLASRTSNTGLILQISGYLPILAIVGGSSIVPREMFPEAIRHLGDYIPTTWFVQALNADISGSPIPLSLPVLWLLMGATALGSFVLAARIFVWNAPPSRG